MATSFAQRPLPSANGERWVHDTALLVTGYAPLALELVAQLGRIDVLVCSVGTGGHSAGVSRALREFFPQLRLVGVDTVGSTIFGQPARTRLMRGLGSSIYPGNIDYPALLRHRVQR